ncbi:MazG-like family protein [Desulfobaculum sp. SPO524]|uniref:MazG-like family protein n=1 Tax=Desulfobaculum sp. SPO524 TaxID=3378071 RepID=UPI0038547AE1
MQLDDVAQAVADLAQKNGWYRPQSKRPQTPRNLAVSLSIEAAELLECFQWTEDANPDAVADEIADVIIYAAQLANVMGMDLNEVLQRKINRNLTRTWDQDAAREEAEA